MMYINHVSFVTAFCSSFFFFFNDTATTEIYTLSLHDALPISTADGSRVAVTLDTNRRANVIFYDPEKRRVVKDDVGDRKSTRLNSSHVEISYAVFCLKKKKKNTHKTTKTSTHTFVSVNTTSSP